MGKCSEISRKMASKDEKSSNTYSWEELYTSLEEANLLIFNDISKNNPLTILLVSSN